MESKLNARFLLNEHGDLYFLLHDFGVQIILFKLKKIMVRKNYSEGKNVKAKRVHKTDL